MKLEEARKLATPAPLIVSTTFGIGHTLATADDRDPVCYCDCIGHNNKADAALLAHCYNHFDEVVEALEMCIALANCSGDACSKEREILARAKEVST